MLYFWQGLSVGLAYSAPLGPQNLFLINSALGFRLRRALLTACIVLFFDVTLTLACFFGVGAVMQRWLWLQMLILLVGGLVVGFIGWNVLRAKPPELNSTHDVSSLPTIRRTIATACVVTWFNPQAWIDGSMLLGAFHASLPPGQGLAFIGGVTAASMCWFGGLTLLVAHFRTKIDAKVLRLINIICGAVILFYAVKLLLDFWQLFSANFFN